ncbi:MAG: ATP-binding protein [Actinobacteria bacterium]|nr:ATP-binding protein [Actinomycetota bacterium]
MHEDKKIYTLPVVVDKSHLITIGEQLYSESIELIRELVNNGYDADATKVSVTISDESISVEDNGLGMDLEGLKQYFSIGSPLKRQQLKSKLYNRDLIGQFGIGKFASLSACDVFKVNTKKDDFCATVIFDKNTWQKKKKKWEIPIEINPHKGRKTNGTTVILEKLTKKFEPEEVRKRLVEAIPLSAPNFNVFVNGVKVESPRLTGHRIPFMEATKFGVIDGQIVILPLSSASTANLGIECKVKGVTIKREMFRMESWGKDIARIKGEVHADFLKITSDRSGFIIDTEEYKSFIEAMTRVMSEVKSVLGQLSNKRENIATGRAVKEALERIQKSLLAHPDLSPFGQSPLSDGAGAVGESAVVKKGEEDSKMKSIDVEQGKEKKTRKRGKYKPKASLLTPNAVVRKIKLGTYGIICCLDHFGQDGPESFSENNIIYINRDHPLYISESKKRDVHILNLARLIAQEISLMKDIKNPRKAFDQQSILLRDAFRE